MNSDFRDLLRLCAEHEEDFPMHYLSCGDLIKAKTLAGRPQDLLDLAEIERAAKARRPGGPGTPV